MRLWLLGLALSALTLGCDANEVPLVVTYSVGGEGIQSVTSIEYVDGQGTRVREATPVSPFTTFVTVDGAQEAEIEVRAIVEPGGHLTASILASRRDDVRQDIETVEQEGAAAGTLTASARLSLD